MRLSTTVSSAASIACLLLLACAQADPPERPARWTRLSEVQIAENDSQYIGLPTIMSLAEDGDFLVSDAQRGTVWQISRAGALVRDFGSQGDGPGEFRQPGFSLLLGDTIFVINSARRRLVAYEARGGRLVGESELPTGLARLLALDGVVYGVSLAASPDRVLQARSGDGWTPRGPSGVPGLLEGRDELRTVFDGVVVAREGKDFVAAFQVSDSLYRWKSAPGDGDGDSWGAPSASAIPLRLRTGARADLLLRASTDPAAAMEAVYGTSIPLAISVVGSELRVLFYDPERVGERMLGRHILAWERDGTWCESEVPLDLDPRPALTLRGDTVFALAQAVRDTDRVTSTFVSLLLQPDAPCAASDSLRAASDAERPGDTSSR